MALWTHLSVTRCLHDLANSVNQHLHQGWLALKGNPNYWLKDEERYVAPEKLEWFGS